MAAAPSVYLVNAWFDALFNNTAFAVTQVYMKLHVGNPGTAGTSNAATETTRQPLSMTVAASGAIETDTDTVWTAIAGSQDPTYFSLWDAASGGNFLGSGLIAAPGYTAGGTYTLPAGTVLFTLPTAA